MYRYVSHRVLLQFGLFTIARAIALRAEMVTYRYSTVYSTGYRVSRLPGKSAAPAGSGRLRACGCSCGC